MVMRSTPSARQETSKSHEKQRCRFGGNDRDSCPGWAVLGLPGIVGKAHVERRAVPPRARDASYLVRFKGPQPVLLSINEYPLRRAVLIAADEINAPAVKMSSGVHLHRQFFRFTAIIIQAAVAPKHKVGYPARVRLPEERRR